MGYIESSGAGAQSNPVPFTLGLPRQFSDGYAE
jgi:hypothetical protein